MADVNAGRNLLFGLLALENGLITQDQLVAAIRAWSCDESRQIADYLVDRGDLDARPARHRRGDDRAARAQTWRQYRARARPQSPPDDRALRASPHLATLRSGEL